MAYKIYQKLKSGMAALGLIDSTDIDTAYDHTTNGVVDRKMTQAELNAKFNDGQDKDGNQLGKTYFGGTGINVATSPEQSGDNVGKYSISLNAADTSIIGGIKLASGSPGANGNSYSVEGDSDDKAKVVIPTATDSQIGLMSAADHQRLNTHAFTVDFGSSQDSVTVMHMDAACTLVRVATQNVSSVTISVVNGGTVTPTLVSGAATISLSCPTETGIVIDIVRTAAGDASVGIKYELS